MNDKLARALKSRYENVPLSFESHVNDTLQTLANERTETIMRRKISAAVILIAALLLASIGAALALNSLGILDFVAGNTGKKAPDEVAAIVQTEFQNNVAQLGDCTITVKEALCDGLSGSLVIEYRLPDGMYMYDPDARAPGTYCSVETEALEDLLKRYDVVYKPVDEHIGFLENGEFDSPASEYGFDAVKVADNVIIVNIGFTVEPERMAHFVYSPGVFKITGTNDEDRERFKQNNMAIGLYVSTEGNFTKKAQVPDELKALGVTAIDVQFTPLSMLVSFTHQEGANVHFEVVDEKGDYIGTDFLSCLAVPNRDASIASAGYTRPETIPDELYVRLLPNWPEDDTTKSDIIKFTLE